MEQILMEEFFNKLLHNESDNESDNEPDHEWELFKTNRNLCDEYCDKWSLYWFKNIFKPILDYVNAVYEYNDEQNYTLIKMVLEKKIEFEDLKNMKKSKLYYKLKKCSKKLKKLYPNMVIIDDDFFRDRCDSEYLSYSKIKELCLKKNPNINFIKRNDCRLLADNHNVTEKLKKAYPMYNWTSEKGLFSSYIYSIDIDNYNKDYPELNLNYNITPEIIKQNKNYPWQFEKLAQNKFDKMRTIWFRENTPKKGNLGFLSNLPVPMESL